MYLSSQTGEDGVVTLAREGLVGTMTGVFDRPADNHARSIAIHGSAGPFGHLVDEDPTQVLKAVAPLENRGMLEAR
jgi:hypothetical protein